MHALSFGCIGKSRDIIPRIEAHLRKVLENAGHGYVIFYMIYITFVVFAVAALARVFHSNDLGMFRRDVVTEY